MDNPMKEINENGVEGKLLPFGVREASTLLLLIGAAILGSTIGFTSSSKFNAELFPGLIRAIVAGLFVACGVLLLMRKEIARQMFFVLFPIAILTTGAAFPLLFWSNDIPFTVLGFFIYAPLVFFLTRAKAVLFFRHKPSGWLGRGGFIILISFILALSGISVSFETFTKLFTGQESYTTYQSAMLVLIINYAAGVATAGIPTWYNSNSKQKILLSDKVGAVVSIAVLLFLILFRVFRPDLSSTSGLATLTKLNPGNETKVIQHKVEGFYEQEATWILEHTKADLLDALKKEGYTELSPESYFDTHWMSDNVSESWMFNRGEGVKNYGGLRPAADVSGAEWCHYVVLSKDGQYSD